MEDENIFDDVVLEEESIPTETSETTEEKVDTAEVSEEPKEEVKEGTDESKLLELLKDKIKYNGESVKVQSLEDLITNYQKGLNYDKLKTKNDAVDSSNNKVLEYISNKAKSLNMSNEEYIAKVQEYEENQLKEKQENEIKEMTKNGVPEEVAREVIETRLYREQLKKEKAEFESLKSKEQAEREKEKALTDFLSAYPDIDVTTIPKEVFAEAEKSSLLDAYRKYENSQLKEKIKILEQNQKNASNSVVTSVNDTGAVNENKDAFILGFDSE